MSLLRVVGLDADRCHLVDQTIKAMEICLR
jgi:hypothetical protein